MKREFPILEYDTAHEAFLEPSMLARPIKAPLPERCVICFSYEAIDRFLAETEHQKAAEFAAESLRLPVYRLRHNGVEITLTAAAVGAPVAVMMLEELWSMGCRKFVVSGSCGVLRQDIAVGHLIIPTSAVRDEGTSYHYAPPSREIEADREGLADVRRVFDEKRVPYIEGKTWTTDALYRETPDKIALRREEGCVTVEMEASALMAAARHRGVKLGMFLYAGDNLGGEEWDGREFYGQTDARELILRLSADICASM